MATLVKIVVKMSLIIWFKNPIFYQISFIYKWVSGSFCSKDTGNFHTYGFRLVISFSVPGLVLPLKHGTAAPRRQHRTAKRPPAAGLSTTDLWYYVLLFCCVCFSFFCYFLQQQHTQFFAEVRRKETSVKISQKKFVSDIICKVTHC